MKKLILCLVILFMTSARSWGAVDPTDCSVYYNVKSKVIGCGGTTKDWATKYACVTKNKTIGYFNTTKNWTIRYGGVATNWTVKHSIIVKNSVVCYASSEEFYDMLYLAADGFTFGFVFDDEHCKDIIRKHPISGRIVAISSRVVAVVIVSKAVTKITYYIIRSFANGGVYTSSLNGAVNYVGQTNNFTRRAAEWAKEGRTITPVFRSPFLCERRVVEETLINRYGITNLVNKIHSTNPTNFAYQQIIVRGAILLGEM